MGHGWLSSETPSFHSCSICLDGNRQYRSTQYRADLLLLSAVTLLFLIVLNSLGLVVFAFFVLDFDRGCLLPLSFNTQSISALAVSWDFGVLLYTKSLSY